MEYKLLYKGTFMIPEADNACVITLTDESEKRALSIVTEKEMATEIKNHEQHISETKNHLVDVLTHIIKDTQSESYHINIEPVRDMGFRAKLVCESTKTAYELRIDDAILLSLTAGFPIYASLDVLQHFSTPYNKNVMSVALPILSLPDSLLQKALDKAIQEENYEGASYIRDEMKRREDKRKKLNLFE